MAVALSSTFLPKNLSRSSFSPTDKVKAAVGSSRLRCSCRKKELHPKFYEDAKVYCNGELVMTTGGTKEEYVVDVWSGNHPYYLGDRSQMNVQVSQLEKFREKYGELTEWMEIPVLYGEIVLPPRKKPAKKK